MQKDLVAKAVNILSKINYIKTQWPLIIAHRGYSSIFPQNTEQSIEAALYKSHLVEFDVMLSKDNQVVIFHDRGLSNLTNVDKISQFSDRKEQGQYDQKNEKPEAKADWWLNSFSTDELKKLKVKQYYKERPQLENLHFKIPLLEQVLRKHLSLKNTILNSNLSGYLIELKSLYASKDDQRDKQLVRQVITILKQLNVNNTEACTTLRLPIVLQSFNHTILCQLDKSELQLPLVHLYDSKTIIDAQFLQKNLLPKSIGIGIGKDHANKQIKQLCQERGLLMFYWTVRDDRPENIPFGLKDYSQVYEYLLNLGVDGIITEFPQKCQEYASLYKFKKSLVEN